MGIWEKILRYIRIWILILMILVVVTIIVYREVFAAVFTSGVQGLITGFGTCILIIGMIVYMLRLMF